MHDQYESAFATPASRLKQDLLMDAAHRREPTAPDHEAELQVPKIPAEGLPRWRTSSAPAWSALHE
jgi:hypothetical protein